MLKGILNERAFTKEGAEGTEETGGGRRSENNLQKHSQKWLCHVGESVAGGHRYA